ncbi:hypothetical protein Cch02nite_46900 [Catellatospora chokoriensis]|uniref:Uncharacterized protein n=1 Tax=Catellatospora chokoriensis TaxID=310353 RepID=A0A8J3K1J2_9ACTN|nr:hypothetical protein Cch02nite_46900 [Catellatospora chokoriensis]
MSAACAAAAGQPAAAVAPAAADAARNVRRLSEEVPSDMGLSFRTRTAASRRAAWVRGVTLCGGGGGGGGGATRPGGAARAFNRPWAA